MHQPVATPHGQRLIAGCECNGPPRSFGHDRSSRVLGKCLPTDNLAQPGHIDKSKLKLTWARRANRLSMKVVESCILQQANVPNRLPDGVGRAISLPCE
eukprot:2441031-Pleurochrysis_carterae.AAC.2